VDSERSRFANWAFVAIGSNLGDPATHVLRAIERLREFSDHALSASSLWQSAPVDCPPGSPWFINAVVGLVPRREATPEAWLDRLQALERELGRKPKQVLNEPRPIDLDLLTFRGETRTTASLTLPHPRAHRRRFVLVPLAEVAPGLCLPGFSQTVAELRDGLEESGEQLVRLA